MEKLVQKVQMVSNSEVTGENDNFDAIKNQRTNGPLNAHLI